MRRVIVFFTCLFSFSALFSWYSNDYPIGSYSYYDQSYADNFYQLLSEANYNNHVCCFSNITNYESILQKSTHYNLDMIGIDSNWDIANGTVGPYFVSQSNNYKFEAEYSELNQTDLDNDIHDKFYYRMPRTEAAGDIVPDFNASNQWVWECDETNSGHEAGLVCRDLYWKWQEAGEDKLLENEIIIKQQDTLYFSIALRIDGLGHSVDTAICDFDVEVNTGTVTSPHYISLNPVSCHPAQYDNQISIGEFNNYDPTNLGYKEFTFQVNVSSIDDNLCNINNGHKRLKNLNFEVYWTGYGKLYLDYFRVYDDVYRKLKDGELNSQLITESNSLPSVKYFYAMDEPKQPQFDAVKLVHDKIKQRKKIHMVALNRFKQGGLQ